MSKDIKIATILPYKENYHFQKAQQQQYGYVNFLNIQNLKILIIYLDHTKSKDYLTKII